MRLHVLTVLDGLIAQAKTAVKQIYLGRCEPYSNRKDNTQGYTPSFSFNCQDTALKDDLHRPAHPTKRRPPFVQDICSTAACTRCPQRLAFIRNSSSVSSGADAGKEASSERLHDITCHRRVSRSADNILFIGFFRQVYLPKAKAKGTIDLRVDRAVLTRLSNPLCGRFQASAYRSEYSDKVG